MNTKHTPTPWVQRGRYINVESVVDGVPGHYEVACIASHNDDKNEANAAFIVRAVNAHEALYNTVKTIKAEFVNHARVKGEEIILDGTETTLDSILVMLSEAISLAEGE